MTKTTLQIQGIPINIFQQKEEDYISLTDIARHKDDERSDYIVQNWLRNKDTVVFIGLWEQLHNPFFNSIEFDGIKNRAGLNSFSLTPKRWIENTGATGIIAKTGRYGGTFAHKDIAFEFASWISPSFKLYLIKEFQRLKNEENDHLKLTWNLHRTLSKINYRIHTQAIVENIIPHLIDKEQANLVYASEADVLNMALFGETAKQWRASHLHQKGNIRDEATIEQLLVLANLESLNAEFIRMSIPQSERLQKLNQIAITQLKSILHHPNIKKIQ